MCVKPKYDIQLKDTQIQDGDTLCFDDGVNLTYYEDVEVHKTGIEEYEITVRGRIHKEQKHLALI